MPLTPATATTLGGVIIGDGIGVDSSGTISVSQEAISIVGGNGINVTVDMKYDTATISGVDYLNGIAQGDGLFVAVGYESGGRIITSPDGSHWSAPIPISGISLFGICYGEWKDDKGDLKKLFVAVGDGAVVTSPDGSHWGTPILISGVILYGITWGNGKFVAVGYGSGGAKIITSENGTAWSDPITISGIDYLFGITWGDGLFVAVGYGSGGSGKIVTSTNGTAWGDPKTIEGVNLNGIAHAAGLFVAVGYGGTILTSPDGSRWGTPITISGVSNLYEITWGNSLFVAVGIGGGSGRIITSTNGTAWRDAATIPGGALNGIAQGAGKFVAVGDSGTVVTSGRLTYTISLA
jgi:hypothetical protein